MIYDKAKITDWGNIETGDKFHGVALRTGRKWEHCTDGKTLTLFKTKKEASDYMDKIVQSVTERGMWVKK